MSDQADEKKRKDKVYFGEIAKQFQGDLTAERIRNLLDPSQKKKVPEKKPKDKRPGILTDPQGSIIQGRMRRYRPVIMHLSKNFTLKLISQDDFMLAVRSETRKLLTSVRGMGRLRLSARQTEDVVRKVIDTLYLMLEGITAQELDVHMAPPLTNKIVSIIQTALDDRADMPDHAKISEMTGKDTPTGSPLDRFPPHIRRALFSRLTAIGLNPHDLENLKRLARTWGIDDPDAVISQLEKGEIPEQLRGLL